MNKSTQCEKCKSHVSYDLEADVLRCDNCGTIVDNEGNAIYENV